MRPNSMFWTTVLHTFKPSSPAVGGLADGLSWLQTPNFYSLLILEKKNWLENYVVPFFGSTKNKSLLQNYNNKDQKLI